MGETKKQKDFFKNLLRELGIYGISVFAALTVISIILALIGYNVLSALRTLLTTSFKSYFGFQETIKKTIPLIFTTYAFTIPFIIKFFNIGGWGQMLFGGTITTIIGLIMAPLHIPAALMVALLMLVGITAGGLYGLLAGYLKSGYNINPIISTIMLNFIAWDFLNFIATSPAFKDPMEGHPITLPLPPNARLGFFAGIPYSLLIAVLAIIFVTVLLQRTKLGYEIRAVGYNLDASETYGINFSKTILFTFLIGGALAGLGGSLEIINIHGRLIEGFAQTSGAQYGIFGILTSLIVAGNPIGVPVAAFFMSVLLVGADSMQRTMQIPVEMVFLTQALIVLFIVSIREKLKVRS
ncbi:MAG: ABC transporter permease [Spirochaetales bacterium]|nr:ABC transporter permease [Spirochaetales bacterium]